MRMSITLSESEIEDAIVGYLVNRGLLDKTTAQGVKVRTVDDDGEETTTENIEVSWNPPSKSEIKTNGEIVRR